MLIDSLVYEKGNPLNYYLNLELLYEVAKAKKQTDDIKGQQTEEKKQTVKGMNKKSFLSGLFN